MNPAPDERTLARLRRFVAARRWRFAKTMPESPHWYTVRSWLPAGQADFEAFALAIRRHGRDEWWRDRTWRYLDLDGFSYWTMGAPVGATTIINRRARAGASADDLVERVRALPPAGAGGSPGLGDGFTVRFNRKAVFHAC